MDVERVDPTAVIHVDGKPITLKLNFGALLKAQKALKVSSSQEILKRCAEIDAEALIELAYFCAIKQHPKLDKEDFADNLPIDALTTISNLFANSFTQPGDSDEEEGVAEKNGSKVSKKEK